MKKITVTLSDEAEKYFNEIMYSLPKEDDGSGMCTQSEAINYALLYLKNFEDIENEKSKKEAEVIEKIKREWQEHNRDYGLTWNEVATLVNQVSRHHTQTSRPSVEEANKIVEENFKGLNDLIEDADFLQFYKSLISDCMVDFAKHHAPTDQCENEPDWNCPKCGFIYTSKVTSDGHCKNCSEQVTQRSHTPTERPSAEDILKQVLEIADYTQELNMANYDHNQVNDLNNAIIEICQLLQHHAPISRPSEEESKEDFLDWLQWKDKLPEEEDPDYYTVTWGMNVWNNAMKFYNK